MTQKLEHSQTIKALTFLQENLGTITDVSLRSSGSVIQGQITDISDPENKGRVKVVLSHLDNELKGEGQFAQEGTWIGVNPPLNGRQPSSLVGMKVLVLLEDSDYNKPFLGEVITLEEPTNKALRLPVYDKGELPPAVPENLGLYAIERNAKPGSDSIVACIKQNSRFVWAGSSHSIQEMTPLNTMGKEAAARGATLQTLFDKSVEEVQSGRAFEPVKDPKQRAILTAVSNALIAPTISPVTKVLKPINEVSIGVLEGSLVRNAEFVSSLSTAGDKVEKLMEVVAGDPYQIPQGIQAVADLIGGTLDEVFTITQDVKQYLSFDGLASPIGELSKFTSLIQTQPINVIKQLPNLVGLDTREITRKLEDVYSETIEPTIADIKGEVERFSQSVQGVIGEISGEFNLDSILGQAKGLLGDDVSSLLERVSGTGLESLFPSNYSFSDLGEIMGLVDLFSGESLPLPVEGAIRSIEDVTNLKDKLLSMREKGNLSQLVEGFIPNEL